MTTLREAREKGKLKEFIAEREAEGTPDADEAAFKTGVRKMAQSSSKDREASKPDEHGG